MRKKTTMESNEEDTSEDFQEGRKIKCRSSHQRCSVIKGVLRNFAKFTGKHLCQGLFFNQVVDLRPTTLLKKRLWHRYFPVNFAKFLKKPFFTEHLWWLLLALNLGIFKPLTGRQIFFHHYCLNNGDQQERIVHIYKQARIFASSFYNR